MMTDECLIVCSGDDRSKRQGGRPWTGRDPRVVGSGLPGHGKVRYPAWF